MNDMCIGEISKPPGIRAIAIGFHITPRAQDRLRAHGIQVVDSMYTLTEAIKREMAPKAVDIVKAFENFGQTFEAAEKLKIHDNTPSTGHFRRQFCGVGKHLNRSNNR